MTWNECPAVLVGSLASSGGKPLVLGFRVWGLGFRVWVSYYHKMLGSEAPTPCTV